MFGGFFTAKGGSGGMDVWFTVANCGVFFRWISLCDGMDAMQRF